jgi:hypothetical protein
METNPVFSQDAAHLRILAIFHYVLGALTLAFTGLIWLQIYWFNQVVKSMPSINMEMQRTSGSVFNPASHQIQTLQPAVVALFAFFILLAILLFYSGRSLQSRSNRTYSMIIAGCLCPLFPLGTILGVFTLIVLCRESVVRLYQPAQA